MKTTKDHPFNFRRRCIAALIACLWCAAVRADAAVVSGRTSADVVWISAPSAVPAPGNFTMVNHDKSFIPEFLVIPIGSTVRFPNEDAFYHSIYSDSPEDPFDIGYYDTGPGKVVRFPRSAVVRVHCHIHVYMHATIVVVNGPFARPTDNRYTLYGVPTGRYALHTWSERRGEHTRLLRVPAKSTSLTLNLH